MPFLSVLVATAKVHLGIDAAVLDEGQTRGAEARVEGDVEAAVAIQEGRVSAVFLQAFLVGQEHWDLGAVFRGDEDLLGDVVVRLEVDGRCPEHGRGVVIDIVLVNRGGEGEGCEGVEHFRFFILAAESDGAVGRQGNLVELLTVHGVDVGVVGGILVVGDYHLAVGETDASDDIVAFGNHIHPVLHLRGLGRYAADAALGRIVVGEDIQRVVDDIDGAVLVVHVVSDLYELTLRVLHIADPQRAASALTAFEEEHIMLIFGQIHLVEIARLCGVGVEEFILLLRCAEFVVVNLMVFVHVAELLASFGAVVGGIEEAVLVPRGARELSPFDVVGEEFEGGHVLHVDLDPVGAAALDGVGHVFAVVGEADAAQRDGAIVGKFVGV